jgi:hypothetical protein
VKKIFYAQYHFTSDELEEMSADDMEEYLAAIRQTLGEVVLRDTGSPLEDDAEVFLRFSQPWFHVDPLFPSGSTLVRMTVER